MRGQMLQEFDHELCRYVLESIGAYMDDVEFAGYVKGQLDAPALSQIRSLAIDERRDDGPLGRPLEHLSCVFGGGPFEFDQPWIACPWYHRLSLGFTLGRYLARGHRSSPSCDQASWPRRR